MDKPKEYVFIDTSFFVSDGYFREGGHVHRLFDLAEQGHITILMPAITEHEWKNKYDHSGSPRFNKSDLAKHAARMGTEDAKQFISSYTAQIEAYSKLMEDAWNHHMDRANLVRLDYDYPADKLKDICEKYTKGEKPFGPGKKKDEFPDAFALASIVKYAEEYHIDKIYVFSQDNDITEFSNGILTFETPKSFLERFNLQIIPQFTDAQQEQADIDKNLLKCYIDTQPVVLVSQITDKIEEYLQDDSNYAERFNYVDIESIDLQKLDIHFNSDNLEILSITKESIEASLLIDVYAIISVTHFDEDMSIWDSEEKDYLFRFDTTTKVKLLTTCQVTLSCARSEEIAEEDFFDETAIDFEDFDFSNIQDAIDESGPWYNKAVSDRNNDWETFVKNQKRIQDMYIPETVKSLLAQKEQILKLTRNIKRK